MTIDNFLGDLVGPPAIERTTQMARPLDAYENDNSRRESVLWLRKERSRKPTEHAKIMLIDPTYNTRFASARWNAALPTNKKKRADIVSNFIAVQAVLTTAYATAGYIGYELSRLI